MATAEVAASLFPENEQTDELSRETATEGIPATTETKEVVEVEDDEEEDHVAPEGPGPEDSSAEKDLEEGVEGTGDDEDEE